MLQNLKLTSFYHPWGSYVVIFVFVFALKGVIYSSKDITSTHKHGDVKTPARRFFHQKNLDARGKDKTH